MGNSIIVARSVLMKVDYQCQFGTREQLWKGVKKIIKPNLMGVAKSRCQTNRISNNSMCIYICITGKILNQEAQESQIWQKFRSLTFMTNLTYMQVRTNSKCHQGWIGSTSIILWLDFKHEFELPTAEKRLDIGLDRIQHVRYWFKNLWGEVHKNYQKVDYRCVLNHVQP